MFAIREKRTGKFDILVLEGHNFDLSKNDFNGFAIILFNEFSNVFSIFIYD